MAAYRFKIGKVRVIICQNGDSQQHLSPMTDERAINRVNAIIADYGLKGRVTGQSRLARRVTRAHKF